MKEAISYREFEAQDINRDIVIPKAEYQYYHDLIGKIDYLNPNDQVRVANTAKVMMVIFQTEGMKVRDDGSPASSHLLETASILAERKMPAIALQYALLHDVPEDTRNKYGLDFIKGLFGEKIAGGVERIGIVKEIRDTQEEQEKSDILRDQELRARLYEAVIYDPLAAITRFAERLHNLRTLEARFKKNPESARRTARESITVYAPLLWDLGEYEMASEMYARSMAMLWSEQMQIIEGKDKSDYLFDIKDERFLAIKPKNQIYAKNKVKHILGIDPDLITIYPPNFENIAQLMLKYGDISKIKPKASPMDIDIIVSGDDKTLKYMKKFLNSSKFYPIEKENIHILRAMQKGKDVPRYMTLILKEQAKKKKNERSLPIPIKFSFLSKSHKNGKEASIMDIYAVNSLTDDLTKVTAKSKREKVRKKLAEIERQLAGETRRADYFEKAIKGEIIFPTIIIDGRVINAVPVVKGSSILEVAVDPKVRKYMQMNNIAPDYFLHLDEVKIQGSNHNLGDQINDAFSIDIKTSKSYTVKPRWNNFLLYADEEIREIISGKLAQLVRVDDKIRREALDIGVDYFVKNFRHKSHSDKRVSVVRGFNKELVNKYGQKGKGMVQFFIDVGIGVIDEKAAAEVVNRMIKWFHSLPQIQFFIPEDANQSGYEAICLSVLAEEKLNIIKSEGGENDLPVKRKYYSADFIYHVEQIDGQPKISLRKLNEIKRKIKNKYKNERGIKAVPSIHIYKSEYDRLKKQKLLGQNTEA